MSNRILLLSVAVLLFSFIYLNSFVKKNATVQGVSSSSFSQHFSQLELPLTQNGPDKLEATIPLPAGFENDPINMALSTSSLVVNNLTIEALAQHVVLTVPTEILTTVNQGINWVSDQNPTACGNDTFCATMSIGPATRSTSGNFLHVEIDCANDCTTVDSTTHLLCVNMLY